MIWLVTQFAQVIEYFLLGLLLLSIDAISQFLQGFSLDTLEKALTVNKVNYYELTYTDVILPIAMSLLLLNVTYHLYKTMFTSDEQSAEDPIRIIFGLLLAMILIYFVDDFIYYIQKFFNELLILMQNKIGAKSVWEIANINVTEFETQNESMAGVISTGANSFSILILSGLSFIAPNITAIVIVAQIIIDILLLSTFFKVIAMFVQRYVYMGFSIFMAPIPMAALPCNSTKNITSNYFKGLFSYFLSYLLSRLYLFFFVIVLAQALLWDTSVSIFQNIFNILLAKGIGEFFLQLDALLDKYGLTNANRYRPSNMLDMAMGRVLGNGLQSALGTTGMLGGGGGKGSSSGGFSLTPDGNGGFIAEPTGFGGGGSRGFGSGGSRGSGMFGNIAKATMSAHNMAQESPNTSDMMNNLLNTIAGNNSPFAQAKDFENDLEEGLLKALGSGDNLKDALNNEFAGGMLSDDQKEALENDLDNIFGNDFNSDFGFDTNLGEEGGYEGFNDTLQDMFSNGTNEVYGTIDGEGAIFTSDGEGGFNATYTGSGKTVSGEEISGNAHIGVSDLDASNNLSVDSIENGKNGNLLHGTVSINDQNTNATIRECSAREVGKNTDCMYQSYQTTGGMRYLEIKPENLKQLKEDGSIGENPYEKYNF